MPGLHIIRWIHYIYLHYYKLLIKKNEHYARGMCHNARIMIVLIIMLTQWCKYINLKSIGGVHPPHLYQGTYRIFRGFCSAFFYGCRASSQALLEPFSGFSVVTRNLSAGLRLLAGPFATAFWEMPRLVTFAAKPILTSSAPGLVRQSFLHSQCSFSLCSLYGLIFKTFFTL